MKFRWVGSALACLAFSFAYAADRSTTVELDIQESLGFEFGRVHKAANLAIEATPLGGQTDQEALAYFEQRLRGEGLSFVPVRQADTVFVVNFGIDRPPGWFEAVTGKIWRSFSIAICTDPKSGLQGERYFDCHWKFIKGRICPNFDPKPIFDFVWERLKIAEPNEVSIPTADMKKSVKATITVSCRPSS